MNEYYKDKNKDKELRNLKERLLEYRPQPEEKIWQNIEKKVAKKAFPFKTLSIIGLIGIIAVTASVIFAPTPTQQASSNKALPTSIKKSEISKTIFSKIENIVNRNNKENSIVKTNNNITTNIENISPVANENNLNKEDLEVTNEIEVTEKNPIEKKTETTKTTTTEPTKNIVIEVKNTERKIDGEQEEVSLSDKLFIPNAFTPTKSTNNIFKPAYKDVKSYDMRIYSRNGSLIFDSKNINNGWDGRIKGSLGKEGMYIYIITFTNKDGKQLTQKGNFMLLN